MPIRVLFWGTPEFAVPVLQALYAAENIEVVGVVTQTDKIAGRGKKMTPPPVKVCALEHGTPIFQPEHVRKNPELKEALAALNVDMSVVAAYGQIIPPSLIELPKYETINVHASLLPRWRGAAPIAHAIWAGDKEAGVSIMKVVKALDAGDYMLQGSVPILPEDNLVTLSDKLSKIGADLLLKAIEQIVGGTAVWQVQDESQVTYASMLSKEDSRLDFTKSSQEIFNQVRALAGWPGTYCVFEGKRLMIHGVELFEEERSWPHIPGVLFVENRRLYVGTGDGFLRITELQQEGKNRVSSGMFLAGRRQDISGNILK